MSDPFVQIELHVDTPPPPGTLLCFDNLGKMWQEGILYGFAGSQLSHVSMVLYEADKPYVFEAYPPVVRKLSWAAYVEAVVGTWAFVPTIRKQGGLKAFELIPPVDTISDLQFHIMWDVANRYLGDPYKLLWNYFKGTPDWHCSEYCDVVYSTAGLVSADGHRCTPSMIHNKLKSIGFTVK